MIEPIYRMFRSVMNKKSDNEPTDVEHKENFDPVVLMQENQNLRETVYDLIKTIKDPEKEANLEELKIVNESDILIRRNQDQTIYYINVIFTPTVPHCNLATLIGLCLRTKLERNLMEKFKLNILVKEGTHQTVDEVNKQINDKERVAAAMENASLKELVEQCVLEPE